MFLRFLFDGASKKIWVRVKIVRETPKAYLIEHCGRREWYPKSGVYRKKMEGADVLILVRESFWSIKFP